MSDYGFTKSEAALAKAIAASALRLPDATKIGIIEAIAGSVRVPEVRNELLRTAQQAGLELPDHLQPVAVETRSPRGVAIAAGLRLRREAKADAEPQGPEAGAAEAALKNAAGRTIDAERLRPLANVSRPTPAREDTPRPYSSAARVTIPERPSSPSSIGPGSRPSDTEEP